MICSYPWAHKCSQNRSRKSSTLASVYFIRLASGALVPILFSEFSQWEPMRGKDGAWDLVVGSYDYQWKFQSCRDFSCGPPYLGFVIALPFAQKNACVLNALTTPFIYLPFSLFGFSSFWDHFRHWCWKWSHRAHSPFSFSSEWQPMALRPGREEPQGDLTPSGQPPEDDQGGLRRGPFPVTAQQPAVCR